MAQGRQALEAGVGVPSTRGSALVFLRARADSIPSLSWGRLRQRLGRVE